MSDWKLAETVASRGNNLVFVAPPSPSAARAVLSGVLTRQDAAPGGLWLALAPAEAVEEWARVAAEVAAGTGQRVGRALTPARLTRLLRSGEPRLVVTSPDTVHELVRRAAIKLGELGGLLLLWPEVWAEEDVVTGLLQEVEKDTQRVVVTADPAASASLIERYCWRAPVTDLQGPDPLDAPPQVRSMPVAWSGRREALLDLIEQLDPETLAVWVADAADRPAIEQALAAAGSSATVGTEPSAASLIVAYDLPSAAGLRRLAASGSVVLLVPPGTEAYVARIAPNRRPLHALGALNAAQAGLSRSRRSIADALERGPGPGSFLAIAPLLERYEATAVAAALYELWERAIAAQGEPAKPTRPPVASVQLWVGIGKRDAVTPHDLVATLLNECGVPKEAIGKIEIRESFSMVQLGAAVEAEQVADKLTGKTIRKRRLVARVDRGRPPRKGPGTGVRGPG